MGNTLNIPINHSRLIIASVGQTTHLCNMTFPLMLTTSVDTWLGSPI